jgi:hypothetical protein
MEGQRPYAFDYTKGGFYTYVGWFVVPADHVIRYALKQRRCINPSFSDA